MPNYGDQFMTCPDCSGRAESDCVDVGVGLYIAGNYWCECGWEINADGKMNVGSYDDYYPDLEDDGVYWQKSEAFDPSDVQGYGEF